MVLGDDYHQLQMINLGECHHITDNGLSDRVRFRFIYQIVIYQIIPLHSHFGTGSYKVVVID